MQGLFAIFNIERNIFESNKILPLLNQVKMLNIPQKYKKYQPNKISPKIQNLTHTWQAVYILIVLITF